MNCQKIIVDASCVMRVCSDDGDPGGAFIAIRYVERLKFCNGIAPALGVKGEL